MSLKVISSNIRFNNPKDGKHDWSGRREILSSAINDFAPDILGTQEGWESQLKDLLSLLNDLSIVQGHRDWIDDRMYPTIFYNEKRFEILSSGDIWLSTTPNVPASKSFKSAFPRLCTWAMMRERDTGKDILISNVHLDHLDTKTRQEQIKVLLTEIQVHNNSNSPMLLMGDFNESPAEEVRRIISTSNLKLIDPWTTLKKEEQKSHHSFEGKSEKGSRIDWILTTENFQIDTIKLYQESTEGIYPSDHFPVFAKFRAF